ncbi:hypothetical protein IIA28_12080 [candidate division KSB1 bacterium]|nr:hypothetical protein [candidate division KSB1 bacterium]MCH8956036.1 hypothetical protein [candidate division KSB1 bacterium]
MTILDLYKPFRRNSYPIISILLVGTLTYFWIIRNFTYEGLGLVTAIAVFLLFNWVWLKPGRSDISDAKTVFNAIGDGKPTFLNIYSNT